MKIVVTLFICDNGHLDAFDPITSRNKLISKIKEECSEIGYYWLLENNVTIGNLETANDCEFIILCEKLISRGHLNVIDTSENH